MWDPVGTYEFERCAWCGGTGRPEGSDAPVSCVVCRGRGGVSVLQPGDYCAQCEGTGVERGAQKGADFSGRCPACGGSGWARRRTRS